MKVNGVDIARYNARQWNIEPGKRTVTNASEMLDGFSVPAMAAPTFGLREYAVMLRIRGGSRTEIWNNASRILSLFRGVAEVEMDGIGGAGTHMFTLSLKGVEQEEYGRMKAGWGMLKLTCVGYEHGSRVTTWLDKEIAITEQGVNFQTARYTFLAEEAAIESESLPPFPTTTCVIADVTLFQKNICKDDGEYFSGLSGLPYPIYADVRIEGICRDAQGKNAGALEFNVLPRLKGEMTTLTPCRDGSGYCRVKVRGESGQIEKQVNKLGDSMEEGRDSSVSSLNMPAPLVWGVPGQEITVSITSYFPDVFKPDYKLGFSFTPIYL